MGTHSGTLLESDNSGSAVCLLKQGFPSFCFFFLLFLVCVSVWWNNTMWYVVNWNCCVLEALCNICNIPYRTVLDRPLLLWTDTMSKATLTKTTFNWGWLTGSEVQIIIIKAGARQHSGRHVQEELRVLHLHLKAAIRMRVYRQLGYGS